MLTAEQANHLCRFLDQTPLKGNEAIYFVAAAKELAKIAKGEDTVLSVLDQAEVPEYREPPNHEL